MSEQEKPLCARCGRPEGDTVHTIHWNWGELTNAHAFIPAEPPAAPRELLGFELRTDPAMPLDGVRLRSADGKKVASSVTNCAAPDSPPAAVRNEQSGPLNVPSVFVPPAQPASAREAGNCDDCGGTVLRDGAGVWHHIEYKLIRNCKRAEVERLRAELKTAAHRTAALEQELQNARRANKLVLAKVEKLQADLSDSESRYSNLEDDSQARIAELEAALRKVIECYDDVITDCPAEFVHIDDARRFAAVIDDLRGLAAALGKGEK